MEYLKDKKFAFVDIETTGGSGNYDRIIEIGVLRVENGDVVKTFRTLINPERPVSPYISQITGINPEELPSAPTFADIATDLSEILEDAIFVAHNARFDYGFIKNEFKRLEINFTATCLCTVRLSRKMFPRFKRHDLSTIIERMGLSCENRHRAYDDAKAMLDFIHKIEDSGRGKDMEKIINELLKKSSFPQFLNEKTVKSLPNGPGIYIFYGEADTALYVGKSKNLRTRVLSHFTNDSQSTKEMNLCKQIQRVEIRQTVGELGALLLESELVKKMTPLYNRQLQRTNFLVIARKTEVAGYFSVEIERMKEISAKDHASVIGVFRSIAQAKKFVAEACDEFGLCPKILGIEKASAACFAYQLQKCKGACMGKADQKEFNKNFNKAFARRKLRAWKYAGPIVIEEWNGRDKHSFMLDNWCLLSEYITSGDEQTPAFKSPAFDYDVYKIFARFLKNTVNARSVKLLEEQDVGKMYYAEDDYTPTISYA